MPQTHYKTITFTQDDGIGHIQLNQPPSNHMTVGFFMELGKLTSELKKKKKLRGIVISGMGRHYSSGAHLGELLGLVETGRQYQPSGSSASLEIFLEENYRSFLYFDEAGIPVVSAIRGVCLGSAMELSLFSHFRFCGEDTVFGLPESTFNLMPGIGGISRLARLSGTLRTLSLVLHGNTFDANAAYDYKIVDRVLPKKRVTEIALDFTKKIADHYRRDLKPFYLKKHFQE